MSGGEEPLNARLTFLTVVCIAEYSLKFSMSPWLNTDAESSSTSRKSKADEDFSRLRRASNSRTPFEDRLIWLGLSEDGCAKLPTSQEALLLKDPFLVTLFLLRDSLTESELEKLLGRCLMTLDVVTLSRDILATSASLC